MDNFIKMLKEKGIYDKLQNCVNETAALTKINDPKAIKSGVADTLPLILEDDDDLFNAFIKDGCYIAAEKLNFQITENLERKKVFNKIKNLLNKISKKDEDKE